jgi:septal ring factor EnvC (AmiA/AmiB activator)
MGLLAAACIGVAAFAWPSNHSQATPEPISTSSVSTRAQTTLQRAAPVAPTATPMAPDLAQSIQMITRERANVEQGIDQLKTGQAQMVRDNAELAEHLKATQEMARHNAELAEDLKAAQAQMARDNVNFAEQLKASQEQIAHIAEQLRESQQQIARLVTSEGKQGSRTLASSPLPIANSMRKRVPTLSSPQVRVQTQDPMHLQPKQQ